MSNALAELKKRHPALKIMVTNRVCRVCTTPFYYDPFFKNAGRPHLPDNHCCNTCAHWLDMWFMRDDPETVRIDGEHYRLGVTLDDYKVQPGDTMAAIVERFTSNNPDKGFGGRKFVIRFRGSGRMAITDDLWSQGTVPELWRELLPDNADFVSL